MMMQYIARTSEHANVISLKCISLLGEVYMRFKGFKEPPRLETGTKRGTFKGFKM